MYWLKQSTTVTVKVGPYLDATDGVTEETALTPGIEVAKNGGAFAARSSGTAVSHDAEGYYDVELNATDTGTLGRLRLKSHDNTTHLPVWEDFMVVPAEVYNAIVAGAMSEPTAVPAWGSTDLGEALAWLMAFYRNKVTQTSAVQTLRDDADTSDIATASVSDDGTTTTRGEFS